MNIIQNKILFIILIILICSISIHKYFNYKSSINDAIDGMNKSVRIKYLEQNSVNIYQTNKDNSIRERYYFFFKPNDCSSCISQMDDILLKLIKKKKDIYLIISYPNKKEVIDYITSYYKKQILKNINVKYISELDLAKSNITFTPSLKIVDKKGNHLFGYMFGIDRKYLKVLCKRVGVLYDL